MEDQKIKKPKNPKYNNSVEYNKNYYAKKRSEILSSLKLNGNVQIAGEL